MHCNEGMVGSLEGALYMGTGSTGQMSYPFGIPTYGRNNVRRWATSVRDRRAGMEGGGGCVGGGWLWPLRVHAEYGVLIKL